MTCWLFSHPMGTVKVSFYSSWMNVENYTLDTWYLHPNPMTCPLSWTMPRVKEQQCRAALFALLEVHTWPWMTICNHICSRHGRDGQPTFLDSLLLVLLSWSTTRYPGFLNTVPLVHLWTLLTRLCLAKRTLNRGIMSMSSTFLSVNWIYLQREFSTFSLGSKKVAKKHD